MSRNGNWVRRISRFGSNAKASELRSRRRLVPGVLALEDRRLLATFTVTSTADTAPATNPTRGTLRWAIEQANRATSPSTIAFNLGGSPTITLAKGQLELTNTKEPITIDGPGADSLNISGNEASRVFKEDADVTATISGLTINNGAAFGNECGATYANRAPAC